MTRLINFQRMWSEYPIGTSEEVKARIGGAVNAAWITNTCVVRLSRSLNYAGMPIPAQAPSFATLAGADGLRYGFRVRELKAYLQEVYGAPQLSFTYGRQGGPPPATFAGQKGIVCFDVEAWSDATGHFDLWDGARCINHPYFDLATAVHLWRVDDGDAATVQPAQEAPMAPPRPLSASVGAGGANRPDDVRLVQTLLAARGVDPGPADGEVRAQLVEAIKTFQRGFTTSPDGRVDVGGRTFRELNGI
jgi:hypothetical protein